MAHSNSKVQKLQSNSCDRLEGAEENVDFAGGCDVPTEWVDTDQRTVPDGIQGGKLSQISGLTNKSCDEVRNNIHSAVGQEVAIPLGGSFEAEKGGHTTHLPNCRKPSTYTFAVHNVKEGSIEVAREQFGPETKYSGQDDFYDSGRGDTDSSVDSKPPLPPYTQWHDKHNPRPLKGERNFQQNDAKLPETSDIGDEAYTSSGGKSGEGGGGSGGRYKQHTPRKNKTSFMLFTGSCVDHDEGYDSGEGGTRGGGSSGGGSSTGGGNTRPGAHHSLLRKNNPSLTFFTASSDVEEKAYDGGVGGSTGVGAPEPHPDGGYGSGQRVNKGGGRPPAQHSLLVKHKTSPILLTRSSDIEEEAYDSGRGGSTGGGAPRPGSPRPDPPNGYDCAMRGHQKSYSSLPGTTEARSERSRICGDVLIGDPYPQAAPIDIELPPGIVRLRKKRDVCPQSSLELPRPHGFDGNSEEEQYDADEEISELESDGVDGEEVLW